MVVFLFISKTPVFWDFFIPFFAEINRWVAHNLNQGDIHMKKLIFSVILTIFITPNVFAGASVVDGGQYSETCRTLSGVVLGSNDSGLTATNTSYCATTGTISYASYGTSGGAASATYTKTYCNSCKSGYILETRYNEQSIARDCLVTWTNCVKEQQGQQICQGLPCQGMEDWESTTNGNEMKCDVSAGKCTYQCRSGYYDRGGMIAIGSAKTCAACPTNATCAGGTAKPSCNAGYYLTSTTSLNMVTYTCPQCPSVTGSNPTVYGTSLRGSDAITDCYIPVGRSINVTEGTYTFTSKCNYSNATAVLPPVEI